MTDKFLRERTDFEQYFRERAEGHEPGYDLAVYARPAQWIAVADTISRLTADLEAERVKGDKAFQTLLQLTTDRDRIAAYVSDAGHATLESEQAWKRRAEAAEARVQALQGGAERYWEGRCRDAEAERDGLRKALELIASHKGKTIYSLEAEYRAGAHDAYEQLADTAIAALAPQHASDCATNNAPALPDGPCDCGATSSDTDAEQGGAR